MKLIKTLAAVAALAVATTASSFANVYTGASALWSFAQSGGNFAFEKHGSKGFGGTAHLGYALDEHNSFNFEVGYLTSNRTTSTVSDLKAPLAGAGVNKVKGTRDVVPFLLNYKFTYDFENQFFMYAGGGLGMASAKIKAETQGTVNSLSARATVFAWQLQAGLGYRFNENIALSAGYNFFQLANKNLKDGALHIGNSYHMARLCLDIHF